MAKKKLSVLKRKVLTIGNSRLITLPQDFAKEHDLERGDNVLLIYDGEIRVIVLKQENES